MMVDFVLNGKAVSCDASANVILLDLLRSELGMLSVKRGCEQGECGACTVLVDGKAVASCLILAASLDGHEVLTIEGLSQGNRLDPLQQAFIEMDAAQCGFCTPGMIMSSKALLMRNPDPSLEEIREAISGNYCRCTGYRSIVEAVELAARKNKERET